ncbi:MAG: efflux RND transporter periplasmic adaptor subunit [Nitrospiraceae bacterium]
MGRLSFLLVAIMWSIGCESTSGDATDAKPPDTPPPGVVRLKPEVAAAAGIETRPVVRGEFRTYRDFPGTVKPNQYALADITPLVRGRVVDAYADLGQEVKAGALLAILQSTDLGIAQSSFLKARAKLRVAERSYNRARVLLKEKVIGEAEAQRREGELISTRAEARESRDRLQLLGMDENVIKRLERDQTIRSFVPIQAPFAGKIIARDVTRGEVVGTEDRLFAVADLSDVWVLANIPEKDILYAHESTDRDRPIEILVSAYPNEVFQGKITYVGDVLDPATRTMSIRAVVKNREGRLKPEMFATVRLFSDPEPDALTIPSTAIAQNQGQSVVFVQLDSERFEQRAVKVEAESGDQVKVLEGLRDGDRVVVRGAFVLKSELNKQTEGGPAG